MTLNFGPMTRQVVSERIFLEKNARQTWTRNITRGTGMIMVSIEMTRHPACGWEERSGQNWIVTLKCQEKVTSL